MICVAPRIPKMQKYLVVETVRQCLSKTVHFQLFVLPIICSYLALAPQMFEMSPREFGVYFG